MIDKIDKIFNKLAEYTGMGEEQKKTFFTSITQGLVANLIKDGQEKVAPETLQKLKNSPSEEFLKQFFNELAAKDEDFKEIFTNRLMEVLEEILEPVISKLTKDQKTELHAILTAGK